MTCSELLKHYGSQAAIARAIGVTDQHVYGWFSRGSVPIEQQMKFEVDTEGALKADISREFRKVVSGKAAA